MKKLILIILLSISSMAHAEWTALNCVVTSQYVQGSIVIEFDEKLQMVRVQNNNNRIFNASITNNLISYREGSMTTQINRLDGSMRTDDTQNTGGLLFNCSRPTKKF